LETGLAGHAAALWTGLHLALLLILSVRVVNLRRKHDVAFGDGGIAELTQAIRAFGNATEYVPVGLIGLGLLSQMNASAIMIHIGGIVLLAGRGLHAFGLSVSAATTMPRIAGMIMTWLVYIYLLVSLITYAVT